MRFLFIYFSSKQALHLRYSSPKNSENIERAKKVISWLNLVT